MTDQHFPLTPEGYRQAIKWLGDKGLVSTEYHGRELTTDGYTIVNLVNHLRNRSCDQSTRQTRSIGVTDNGSNS